MPEPLLKSPDASQPVEAEIYRHLGLALVHDPGKHKVLVETSLNQHMSTTRRLPFGVRGGT
ncbi:hypothetical protein [Streptomyces sp. NPDC059757]|uniref:hypothetical protein n=1 Tax=unclassified Streptomyces TaxID=2593676 RepID=UPI003649F8CF